MLSQTAFSTISTFIGMIKVRYGYVRVFCRLEDAVTIKNLPRRIIRTQVRIATITLRDSSERIVLNNECITQKPIHCTVTDLKRRRYIPTQIIYGSKPEGAKNIFLLMTGRDCTEYILR